MMPLLIARRPAAEARRRARQLLAELGLEGRGHHRPGALSGGEQQRVAVGARAGPRRRARCWRTSRPGNLDQATGERLHELLRRLNREQGLTVVAVTHNDRLAAACDRTLRLSGGRLQDESGRPEIGSGAFPAI